MTRTGMRAAHRHPYPGVVIVNIGKSLAMAIMEEVKAGPLHPMATIAHPLSCLSGARFPQASAVLENVGSGRRLLGQLREAGKDRLSGMNVRLTLFCSNTVY
jgi:hypothetical protein